MLPRAQVRDRIVGVALGAIAARGALSLSRTAVARGMTEGDPTSRWDRTNFRGETVSLLAGPAYTVGATAALALTPGLPRGAGAAAIVATGAAGALGLLDDLAGSGAHRGLRGHLSAVRRGEVTTGLVKVGGLAVTGVVAARLVGHRGADALMSGAVVAGAANLVNLLDLRPGRASKVALGHATALVAFPGEGFTLLAAPLGAAAGLLPDDLRERTMLGDAGANALGAAIGVAAITSYGRAGRFAHLVGIAALTLASERISFTQVIDTTPSLRWLDGLGRRR